MKLHEYKDLIYSLLRVASACIAVLAIISGASVQGIYLLGWAILLAVVVSE
jgi:hypothetical protein